MGVCLHCTTTKSLTVGNGELIPKKKRWPFNGGCSDYFGIMCENLYQSRLSYCNGVVGSNPRRPAKIGLSLGARTQGVRTTTKRKKDSSDLTIDLEANDS